jgi:hypothetical protein
VHQRQQQQQKNGVKSICMDWPVFPAQKCPKLYGVKKQEYVHIYIAHLRDIKFVLRLHLPGLNATKTLKADA